jgi:hypothetical protein
MPTRIDLLGSVLLRVLIMKRTRSTTLTALLLFLSIAGCRGPLPCTGCEEQGEDESPPDDLPCGGADLMTDNLNCGACGNECAVCPAAGSVAHR